MACKILQSDIKPVVLQNSLLSKAGTYTQTNAHLVSSLLQIAGGGGMRVCVAVPATQHAAVEMEWREWEGPEHCVCCCASLAALHPLHCGSLWCLNCDIVRQGCITKDVMSTLCCHAKSVAWTNRVIFPRFIMWATVLWLFGCLASLDGPLVTCNKLALFSDLSDPSPLGHCLSYMAHTCHPCLSWYHDSSWQCVKLIVRHLQPCNHAIGRFLRCDIVRVGQNCIYAPYMAVYLVISLPKVPYVHRIFMVLANPRHWTAGFCEQRVFEHSICRQQPYVHFSLWASTVWVVTVCQEKSF